MGSDDYLHALETMGKILLLTPLLMAFINLIVTGSGNGPNTGSEVGYSAGLMTTAGFFTLIYTAILRFRDGYREGSRKG
jgi:hypothetical protein